MLLSLQVKNLAIIEEEEIEFKTGLNILSGETGAGKSIILGALSLAMGEKPKKGLIRDESKEAFAEAIFSVNDRQKKLLSDMDIEVFDGELILQRKITPQRSSAKINGESVPADKLSKAAELLIDIYGQHEQQTLLSEKNHIMLLDEYAKGEISSLKDDLAVSYDKYKALLKEFENNSADESERLREVDLLSHEIAEIESVNPSLGEDESLKEEYKKLSKTEKVVLALKEAISCASEEHTEGIGRAIRSLRSVEDYDEEITSFADSLNDVESILRDIRYSLSSFEESLSLSPQRLMEVSERIDLLDSLKRRFSKNGTIEEIYETLEYNKEKLERLNHYENYIQNLKSDMEKAKAELLDLCQKVSYIRKKSALELMGLINEALLDLNFNGEGIEIKICPADEISKNGSDNVSFYISTNPGEAKRPLKDIASGGELSRIMLAIKTIFAGTGEIDTLVFDEIDSGVSGKTAARIADRLSSLAKSGQIICITHLPQIAAKADNHFLIEKNTKDNATTSSIRPLNSDEHINEVARMLAGDDITEAAIENAKILISGKDES